MSKYAYDLDDNVYKIYRTSDRSNVLAVSNSITNASIVVNGLNREDLDPTDPDEVITNLFKF